MKSSEIRAAVHAALTEARWPELTERREGASVGDIPSIPGELFAKFQTGFYSDPTDAVFKALGVS